MCTRDEEALVLHKATILMDFNVPVAWQMPLPISLLAVTIYNYHPSPKCLQPCLILVFKVMADVHFCHMPIAISCKTNGFYIFICERLSMVNDSNNTSPRRHLGIPTQTWANTNPVDPMFCGLLSLDLACNYHFDKAGTPTAEKTRRWGPNGCCQVPWSDDIFFYLICLSCHSLFPPLDPFSYF